MSSKSIAREVIFFVLIFLLFYLGGKLANYWQKKVPKMSEDGSLLLVGLGVTAIVIGVFYLAKLNQQTDSYKDFSISPGALCQGYPYMFQGDDAQSQFCKKLASTSEGKCEMSKHRCPNGYIGAPGVPLEFTSNSDSCWSGVHCKDNHVNHAWYKKHFPHHFGHPAHGKDCNCSLCSMWTNEYTFGCK